MNAAVSTATMEWRPRYNPWLIALPVMLATFMVILDTSIVVVALPYIAGNLGATQDESTWVLTSYLVANAVVLPASAWFASFFGRRRFLMGCTIVFTLASICCGMASSMTMLVVSRILQGLGGGAMQPLSQAIMLESFPPNQRGTATALFGLAVVVAPIIGPTLGGWLTDQFSWRWAFYINFPVGVAAIFLMLRYVEDPPYIRASRPGQIDGIGFALMAVWLSTMQIVLDKGQDADWFSAGWICWFAVVSILSLVGFVVRELYTAQPIVNLRIFKNRNFAISSLLFGAFSSVIYALITLQPLFLQSLLGFTAFDAGLSVTPRGFGALAALFIVGMLVRKVSPKVLVGFGFAMLGMSSFMLCHLSLQTDMNSILFANIVAGIGTSFIFVPLTTLGIGTLTNEEIGNATGIQNLLRNIGGSVGLSFVSTMLVRYAQTHQAEMVGHMSYLRLQYQQHLAAVQRSMEHHFSPVDALARANDLFYHVLIQQSNYWAFVNLFFVVACLCWVCVLCVMIFEKPRQIHAVSIGE
jgi:DHA2 family multidrug resistance protein